MQNRAGHGLPQPSLLTTEADAVEDHRCALQGGSGFGSRRDFSAVFGATVITVHRATAGTTAAAHWLAAVRDTGATAALAGAQAGEQTATATARRRTTAGRVTGATAATPTGEQTAASASATIAAATTARSAGATAATLTSVSLVVSTQQSDADDREKHRDTKHNKSIHPRLLHRKLTGTVSESYLVVPSLSSSRPPIATACYRRQNLEVSRTKRRLSAILSRPVSKLNNCEMRKIYRWGRIGC